MKNKPQINIINPEQSAITMSNLNLIDRKNKKQVVCETRRGGAEVQLPLAGTHPELDLAEKVEHGIIRVQKGILALGGVFGTGHKLHSRERLVLAPGIKKPQGGRSLVARRVHAPEVAGSNPAPAIHLTLRSVGKLDIERYKKTTECRLFIGKCENDAPLAGGNRKKACVTPQAATMDAKGHGQASRTRHDTERNGFDSRLRHSSALLAL